MRGKILLLALLLCLHGQSLAQDGKDKITLDEARKTMDVPLERQLPENGEGR